MKIGVLITKNNKTVFKYSELVDELIECNFSNYIKNYKKWDLLLDFENNFNSSSLFADRILTPKWSMIFKKYNKKHYNFDTIKTYDFYAKQENNYPLSHYISNSPLGKKNGFPKPYSVIKVNENEYISVWKTNKFRLLLCPQGSKRQIPPKELANFLNQSIPSELLSKIECIISYTETSEKYLEELSTHCKKINFKLSGKTSLPEYFCLLKTSDFVLAVDGGSLHLACAFNKPIISFFADCQPNVGAWEPLINPNKPIPNFKILTKTPTSDSNATEDFYLNAGIAWFKLYLSQKLYIQKKLIEQQIILMFLINIRNNHEITIGLESPIFCNELI